METTFNIVQTIELNTKIALFGKANNILFVLNAPSLTNAPPTFWNQNVDKMTRYHSKWVQQVCLLDMIYNHKSKFGG